ncbi:MAG: hypothetical protein J5858_16815 [Lentisphaeria bacterium]|nr:hypothetical protein [Lentisphaeria bacterium]
MKNKSLLFALLALGSLFSVGAAGKPVLIFGYRPERRDYSIAMQKALDAKDRKKFLAVREETRKWIQSIMYESPTPYALTPDGYYRNSHLASR